MLEVRLFATLREGREKVYFLEAEKYKVPADILDELKIPHEEVAITLINGRHSKLDTSLKDGDLVAIFPPVGGG
ncbi:MAG: MoaD/ThiS family protein [Peptococcaceae bacterium]|nr:MoaD/ThiS family protein [Peptococcaceae bacterium]